MSYGLIVSLILHAAILGWTLLSIESTPPLAESKPEPVEISIISPDDIVRLKQGDREAKNMEAEGKDGAVKEPPKKEPVKPTPPPPPPPAAAAEPPPPPPQPPEPVKPPEPKAAEAPPPPPAPTVDDQKLLEEKLAEDADLAAKAEAAKVAAAKAAEAKAVADAKKAEDDRKKKLAEELRKKELEKKRLADLAKAKADAKKIADAKAAQSLDSIVNAALAKSPDQAAPPKALLDKTPAKPAQVAGAKASPNALKGPAAGAPEGTDNRLTADKLSMLGSLMKNNVKRCWNINSGMEGASRLVIKAQVKLTQDGRLVGEPMIVNTGSGPQFEDAANSAKRALIDCQPYTNLPPELYAGGWDFMALTFDPSKMF